MLRPRHRHLPHPRQRLHPPLPLLRRPQRPARPRRPRRTRPGSPGCRRDDLPDGGAAHFAAVIAAIRAACGASVEVLTPDFAGREDSLDTLLAAFPEVFNHNLETIPRLYPSVRPGADYRRSLALLAAAARRPVLVKSGLMLGLGEQQDEIHAVLADLAAAGVRALTLGQYLRPSPDHLPVSEYIHPDTFRRYEEAAYALGFSHVAAGPLVRSSYHAAAFVDGQNPTGS